MLLAGLDGIKNKIHPGDPMEKDLYELSSHETAELGSVATSLGEALQALNVDRDFLKVGNVFTDDIIESYINLKAEEIKRLQMTTHPLEFELYYSL
jgi:glutamine synthetase